MPDPHSHGICHDPFSQGFGDACGHGGHGVWRAILPDRHTARAKHIDPRLLHKRAVLPVVGLAGNQHTGRATVRPAALCSSARLCGRVEKPGHHGLHGRVRDGQPFEILIARSKARRHLAQAVDLKRQKLRLTDAAGLDHQHPLAQHGDLGGWCVFWCKHLPFGAQVCPDPVHQRAADHLPLLPGGVDGDGDPKRRDLAQGRVQRHVSVLGVRAKRGQETACL